MDLDKLLVQLFSPLYRRFKRADGYVYVHYKNTLVVFIGIIWIYLI